MSPRKARQLVEATPTRSSARLRGKRGADGAGPRVISPVKDSIRTMQDDSVDIEEVKDALQEERLRREWQEELSGVEERIAIASASLVEEDPTEPKVGKRSTLSVDDEVATASGALVEDEDIVETAVETRSTLGAEEEIVVASGVSLEEKDTAETGVVTRWTVGDGGAVGAEDGEREMFDPACSFQRSKPGILTRDSARRQFEFPENPEPPSSALSSLLVNRWHEASKALALAINTFYKAIGSTYRRFQPLARFDRKIDFEDTMLYFIRILALLVLLSTTVYVGWKISGTNLDDAARSACKIPSLGRVCKFSCEHTKTLFPTACSGDGSADGEDSHMLPDDQTVLKISNEPSLLDNITLHEQNCSQSRNVRIPMIYDELPILAYVEIATASEDVCDLLKPLVSELMTYYSAVHSSTAHIHNDLHFLRKFVREGIVDASKEPWAVSNKTAKEYMAMEVSSWKDKFRASSEAGSRMQDGIDPLRQSLKLLLMGLQEGLAIMLQARNETILQLPWHRKATLWTQLSWLEPKEIRAIMKAILVLKQWVSDASGLEDILSEVYSDVVVIIRMVRDVYAHRLGHSAQALWTDAELSEMLQFLDRMSEDVERIRSAARDSRVMAGFLQEYSRAFISEPIRFEAKADTEEMVSDLER